MKNLFKAMRSIAIAAIVAVIGFSMVACDVDNGNGDTTPTVTLSPSSVTINNGNLMATVTVGGRATGEVTLQTFGLPTGVTVAVSGTTITVTGVRPTTEHGSINGSYTVFVTRQSIQEQLTVNVNLTTTWATPTVTLTPASVTISDSNLTPTVTVGGTATGAVTLDTAELPFWITASASGGTITVTGVRPATKDTSRSGTFTVPVTREGVTEDLSIQANLTSTWTDPCAGGHTFVNVLCSVCGAVNLTTAGLYLGAPADLTSSSTPIIEGATSENIGEIKTYISNNFSEEHTLLINEDFETFDLMGNLTIIGIGTEETNIRPYYAHYPIFSSGTLTIGKNVTLHGRDNSTRSLVSGANFTMLNGSKITGNQITDLNSGYYNIGAAVTVDSGRTFTMHEGSIISGNKGYSPAVDSRSGTFTMKGGTITENENISTSSMNPASGVYGNFIMEGGSIEGNIGQPDVFVFGSLEPTLSGSAAIGTMTMSINITSYTYQTFSPSLKIESGWTGTIARLNLGYDGGSSTIDSRIEGYWTDYQVLNGDGVNADTVGQITLGNFMNRDKVLSPISNTREFNASGVLVEK